MSSLFNHIFIPIVILIIFSNRFKLDYKKIIGLSIFGILPDIDIFILTHRATFHNLVIFTIPIIVFILLRDLKISGIISFYLISHLILDIFNGGIYILYPFYDNVIYIITGIWFYNSGIISIFDYGINEDIVKIRGGESIISSENVGIIILLLIITIIYLIYEYRLREERTR